MTFTSMFKAGAALSLAGLLAACGGGGNSASPSGSAPPPELPAVAWASPAVFVTPGAASKSFAMENCTRQTNVYVYDYRTQPAQFPSTNETIDMYTATFVVASNGDMSFNGATTNTGTVSKQWGMIFADAVNVSWSASGTTQTPSYQLSGNESFRNSSKNMNANSSSESSNLRLSTYENVSVPNLSTQTYVNFSCEFTDLLALQVNVDQARAAKNLGTEAGVNTFDNYDLEGRIEGGKAFWRDPSAMEQNSNLRFDLKTGELASSPSTTGTYSVFSLALPSSATEIGSYSESLTRGQSQFSYKDAKGVCFSKTDTNTGTGLSVNAFAYGNRFYPVRGNYINNGPEERNEVTLVGKESSCNNYFD